MNRVETTVFELAGPDRPGLLAEVTHLLTHNGCNIRSAAVSAGLRWHWLMCCCVARHVVRPTRGCSSVYCPACVLVPVAA